MPRKQLQRPLGLSIISVLYWIIAGWLALSFLVLLIGSIITSGVMVQSGQEMYLITGNIPTSIVVFAASAFLLAAAALHGFAAYGLWRGKPRARTLTIIVATITILRGALTVTSTPIVSTCIIIFGLVVLLYVFLNKNAKQFLVKKI
jgi:hypothetical protein